MVPTITRFAARVEWQNDDHCMRVETQSCGSKVNTDNHHQLILVAARTSEGVGRSMDHLVVSGQERWSDGATAVGCVATGTRRRFAAASVPWEADSV